MKRKLFAISLVAALLVSAYTAYACLSTRGLRIYLMGTQMGAIFAGTWQYTLLAAIVLWLPGAVALFRTAAGLRRRKAVPAEAQMPTEILTEEKASDATELLEPRKPGDNTAQLLEPRKGGKETAPLFEGRESAGPGCPGPEPAEPTELIGKAAETASAPETGKALLTPPEGTELLPEKKGPVAPERADVPLKFCPNCGHPVAGKKFCIHCGTRVG